MYMRVHFVRRRILFFGTIADRTHIIIKTSGQTLHCPRPSKSTNFSTIAECLCCGMEKSDS